MRFLIAPDKFKGSLSARAVAENIAIGIRDVLPDAQVDIAPIADGGEGTAEIIGEALGAESVSCSAHDALGRAITARYRWIEQTRTAVMEMSEAAGLRRLSFAERDPARATTVGVGEMILDAEKRGAVHIVVGLGGSATNDGGFGMARSLGFRFFAGERELRNGPRELTSLEHIVSPSPHSSPRGRGGREAPGEGSAGVACVRARITGAMDVQNPLPGERGATRVFGRQKGATPEQIELLETALTRLAIVVARDLELDYRNEPGAGAAGGLGFGLVSFCGAELRGGFDIVADAIGLAGKVSGVDVVITGEGRLDAQTGEGKAPAGVAKLAREAGKRVYAIVGDVDRAALTSGMFDDVFVLARPPIARTLAIKLCPQLLRERASELARIIRDASGRRKGW